MEKKPVIELHYLPSIAYFSLLKNYEKVIIEVNDFYEKQSYRNRCYILGPNKVQPLIVPVIKGSGKKPLKDVRIDHKQKWRNIHWQAIASAYGKAPFFEYFAEEFLKIYQETHFEFLIDLNRALLTKCLDLMGIEVEMSFSRNFIEKTNKNFIDYRNSIHLKKSYDNKIFFKPFSYNQLFGKDFVPNLSVLDLLFCEGPNGLNNVGTLEEKEN